ncbi:MAG: hypothetical protein WAV09_00195, partial [Minisyncoccia bacterium]
SILGSLITLLVQYYLKKNETKEKLILESQGNIKRNLYLLRMAYYVRYECEIFANYYEALHRITGDKFFHDKLSECATQLQPYSDRIYKVYSDLHFDYSKIQRYLSSKDTTELSKVFDIDNYQTLTIKDSNSVKTAVEASTYKHIALESVKHHVNDEMKKQFNNFYKEIASKLK